MKTTHDETELNKAEMSWQQDAQTVLAIKTARRLNYQQQNSKERNNTPLKHRGSMVYVTKTALRQHNTATEHHGISWRPKNTCDPFEGSN